MPDEAKVESPKLKKIRVKIIKGLAADWEAQVSIREHIKEKKPLFPEGADPCLKGVVVEHAHAVLKVLCLRTATVAKHPVAPVNDLRDQLTKLYHKCGVQVDDHIVINDSWCIRKFLSWIKMKVRKEKPSTAP